MVHQIGQQVNMRLCLSPLSVIVPLVNFKALDTQSLTEDLRQFDGPLRIFLELGFQDSLIGHIE